ncbi:hypothetical protein M622_12110 [Thauera terpenica 58Eu]|uniref:Uncharacterized protein n=1 Tax=Thauera terpenica 58Eu TaxID=1348657 RepID=T0AUF5_9RHOO|nr:hypothetical protein M622_12110 [Thauera terpenica 58Eu]
MQAGDAVALAALSQQYGMVFMRCTKDSREACLVSLVTRFQAAGLWLKIDIKQYFAIK